MSNTVPKLVSWYQAQTRYDNGNYYVRAEIMVNSPSTDLSTIAATYGGIKKPFSSSSYFMYYSQKVYTVNFSLSEMQSNADAWATIIHLINGSGKIVFNSWGSLLDVSQWFTIGLTTVTTEPYVPVIPDPADPDEDDEIALPTEQGEQPSLPTAIEDGSGTVSYRINDNANSEWLDATTDAYTTFSDNNTDTPKFDKTVFNVGVNDSLNSVNVKHDYPTTVKVKVKIEYKVYWKTTVIR